MHTTRKVPVFLDVPVGFGDPINGDRINGLFHPILYKYVYIYIIYMYIIYICISYMYIHIIYIYIVYTSVGKWLVNGVFHILIDGIYWGYNPLILTF